MKRKRFDWDICPWITKKRYVQSSGNLHDFKGVAGLIYIDEVTEPHQWDCGRGSFMICQKGMKWLLFIPHGEKYMITSYIDTDGRISAWYVDMIDGYGYCNDGVAYYDDLYLDIGLMPNGGYIVQDMDELVEALGDGVITKEQYDMAIATKDKLISGILHDTEKLNHDCMKIATQMERKI